MTSGVVTWVSGVKKTRSTTQRTYKLLGGRKVSRSEWRIPVVSFEDTNVSQAPHRRVTTRFNLHISTHYTFWGSEFFECSGCFVRFTVCVRQPSQHFTTEIVSSSFFPPNYNNVKVSLLLHHWISLVCTVYGPSSD